MRNHGVVVLSVIRNNKRPPSAVAVVGATAVKQVAVEENGVPSLHLHIGVAQSFLGELHPLEVGPRLSANHDVFDPTQLVRTRNDLLKRPVAAI